MQIVKVPQLPWHGPKDNMLTMPDDWDIEISRIAGHDQLALNDVQVKEAIDHPIAGKPLREIARNRKEAVIIIDDLTRVTRTAPIIPHILAELAAAGIPDANIRFIPAVGCHGPLNRTDFIKKLGEDVVSRYRAYNHNIYENCTAIGTTSRGTPVKINSEVMNCDLKIVIGSTFPHRLVSYSGAAKMILPGVAGIETIEYNHTRIKDEVSGDDPDCTAIYLDMNEAARMAGLDFAVEGLVNEWGDTVALFAGDFEKAHLESVDRAHSHYRTRIAQNKDIVIANSFAKATEFTIAMQMIVSVKYGGDMVVIGNAPDGMVIHYYRGTFGKTTGGRARLCFPIPHGVNSVILLNEYPDMACADSIQECPKRILMRRWDEVLDFLRQRHGDKASVVVYPSADLAHLEDRQRVDQGA